MFNKLSKALGITTEACSGTIDWCCRAGYLCTYGKAFRYYYSGGTVVCREDMGYCCNSADKTYLGVC